MKRLLVILLSVISLTATSQNISKHQQFWFSGIYSFKKEKLNIVSEGSYRNDNWFRYTRQVLLREMFFYSKPIHEIGGGCILSWQYPYSSVKPVFELRPTLEAKLVKGLDEGSLYFRLRWEMRFFKTSTDFSSPIHRGRFQLKWKKILTENSALIISNEIMLQNDSGSFKFSTNRVYAGWQKNIGKTKLDIGLMFQWIDRRNQNFDADFITPITISN